MTLNTKENNLATLSAVEISNVNSRHIRGMDKWNRMFLGWSSDLEKYEDGIIHIKVENTEKAGLPYFEKARNIVKTWVDCNDELKQAKGWVVYFYRTSVSTGFAISFDDLKNEDVIKKVIEQMRGEGELQLIGVFSGVFK